MTRNELIDKIYRVTYKFNSKIFDVCVEGNKIIFNVDSSFKESLLDGIKKELSSFIIVLDRD